MVRLLASFELDMFVTKSISLSCTFQILLLCQLYNTPNLKFKPFIGMIRIGLQYVIHVVNDTTC